MYGGHLSQISKATGTSAEQRMYVVYKFGHYDVTEKNIDFFMCKRKSA